LKVLLDTHALLWWQSRSKRLSRPARKAISSAEVVLISAVSCWEVATLAAQGRIELDRSLDRWLSDMEKERSLELVALSPRAAILAFDLARAGFHGDPADRLIYATAVERMVPLVTADERITTFAEEKNPALRIVW
jgi:PIN domain nuclease of toxin-antitoxin system